MERKIYKDINMNLKKDIAEMFWKSCNLLFKIFCRIILRNYNFAIDIDVCLSESIISTLSIVSTSASFFFQIIFIWLFRAPCSLKSGGCLFYINGVLMLLRSIVVSYIVCYALSVFTVCSLGSTYIECLLFLL